MRVALLISIAVGGVVAAFAPVIGDPEYATRTLAGLVAAFVTFSAIALSVTMRMDAAETRERLIDVEPSRSETDLIVVLAAVAALAGVAVMLLSSPPEDEKVAEAVLAIATVSSAWVAIHTIYAMRYARHYISAEPGCIDFNSEDPPQFSDFAYLSFTLGMTYQVSDTNLSTPAVRKIVLHHTLLSYLLGTGVIATTINLVAGLAH